MKVDCPKCGSPNAWYTRTDTDLLIKCLCGALKVVFSTLVEDEPPPTPTPTTTKLPKLGSNLRKTLNVLSIYAEATSAEVMDRLQDMGETFSMSDVSTYLTILRGKGLVQQVLVRRGVAGGSTWTVSDEGSDLLYQLELEFRNSRRVVGHGT